MQLAEADRYQHTLSNCFSSGMLRLTQLQDHGKYEMKSTLTKQVEKLVILPDRMARETPSFCNYASQENIANISTKYVSHRPSKRSESASSNSGQRKRRADLYQE